MNYAQARSERILLQRQLQNLLNTPGSNQRDITHIRGRLLNAIRREYRLAPINAQVGLKRFYLTEINNHRMQLTARTRGVTNQRQNLVAQVSREVVLKFQRARTNLRGLDLNPTGNEGIDAITGFAGQTLSSLGSVAKIPVALAASILRFGSGALARITVAPLHIISGLYQKIWNPQAKYRGETLNRMEAGLRRTLNSAVRGLEERIRRL